MNKLLEWETIQTSSFISLRSLKGSQVSAYEFFTSQKGGVILFIIKIKNGTLYAVNSRKTHRSIIQIKNIINPTVLKYVEDQYEFVNDYMNMANLVISKYEENLEEKINKIKERLYNSLTEKQKLYYEVS